MRLLFLLLALSATLLFPQSHAAETPVTTQAPKNVILVLIDDMGYGDVAAHGNPVVKTPHLDALRAESADFDCELCSKIRRRAAGRGDLYYSNHIDTTS